MRSKPRKNSWCVFKEKTQVPYKKSLCGYVAIAEWSTSMNSYNTWIQQRPFKPKLPKYLSSPGSCLRPRLLEILFVNQVWYFFNTCWIKLEQYFLKFVFVFVIMIYLLIRSILDGFDLLINRQWVRKLSTHQGWFEWPIDLQPRFNRLVSTPS